MKLPQLKIRKNETWVYYLLSFLFPAVCMLVVMIVCGFTPFGNSSMLYSDQYHQYYPFLVEFRKALLSGDSLLHSWNVGMGMDYLGLISYYLASPFYLLTVFVPENMLLQYFSLLTPIRLGLAGLFFAIFLNKLFRKNDLSIVLFGAFYALCAWALGYMWNVMWMDTFALLPLVMLGTVSLLRDKKFVLYTLTLFLSIYSNYYIGLFTCIFVFLGFFCYEICRWSGFKKFFFDLCRIALFSLLAIGMTAILELPALAALQTTHSGNNTFPEGFKLNITDDDTWLGLLDAMRQVAGNMNGAQTPSFKEGLPNLYCGVVSIIFAFLFLTCKEVRVRDKICCVFLLLFFNVSFIIRQLDYIWHGFHFTNMIPYRFSFLYSFVLLYMAYRAYLLRSSFRLWQICVAIVLAIGIAFCTNDLTDPVYWAYNGAFLLLYLAALLLQLPWKRKEKPESAPEEIPSNPEAADLFAQVDSAVQEQAEAAAPAPKQSRLQAFLNAPDFRPRFAGLLLCAIMVVELILNVVNFSCYFGGTSIVSYPRGTTSTASMIRYMKQREKDNLFYRAEVTHTQTLNDGALNGYNGISTFTSSANVSVTTFMQALGYGARNSYNRYCFEEASPISNLFLGLKYMIARDGKVEDNAYFDVIHNYNNVYLLENNAYLPLGFLAEPELLDVNFTAGNHFVFQNNLLSAASGIEADYWKQISKGLAITGNGVTVKSTTNKGYCSYAADASAAGTLTYTYTIEDDGFMCIYLNLPKKNKCSIWLNGKELYSETYSLPQMLSVSDVQPGDVVELKLTCAAGVSGTMTIQSAILDEEAFRSAYNVLAASTLELTDFTNTYVAGTIDCDRDGLLYTSIPQNGNWFATVDGVPAETQLVGGAMVALQLTEGTHTIEFHYENKAFSLGWKISLGCLMVFAALYLLYYKPYTKQKTPSKDRH